MKQSKKKSSCHELRIALRKVLTGQQCVSTASVFDPMSARIAADLGFEAGILGGSVASLQVLAAPDLALITLSEFAEQATRIGRVAELPMIVDADHGYGNALNVMRTVVELERAGMSALTIEDTLLPLQFGQKPTDLISLEEGVGKIRAACEARTDPELIIIARTSAAGVDIQEARSRAHAYQQAGADAICFMGVKDLDHLTALTESLTLPAMLVTYGNPLLADCEELAKRGVRIVVNGHSAYFAAIKATYDRLRKQRGGAGEELTASELARRYSLPEDYTAWSEDYLDCKS